MTEQPQNSLKTPEGVDPDRVGIIVVDHGSKRQASNEMLLEVARLFQESTGYAIVEPAHMELAEPTIAQAFDRCVERGAELVVCHPYFLLPGRHWNQDIPELVAEAAAKHPGIRWMVTAPLGLNEKMALVMDDAIRHCLARVQGDAEECPACAGTGKCQLHVTPSESAATG